MINTDKTKILVFGQHPNQTLPQWSINSNPLEVVEKFKYLGCWLNWRCNLKDSITETFNKADKSLQQLQIKIISLGITNFKTMEHLYKSLIQPILLFNSEIWGIYNTAILEKTIRKFYKFALRVSPSCTTTAIHAETGTLPLSFDCIRSSLNYYYHIISNDPNCLTSLALQTSINLATSGHKSWAFLIRNQLAHLGFNSNLILPDKAEVLTRLHEQHIQSLQSDLSCAQGATQSGGSKLRAYRLIKHDVTVCEPYLALITNPKARSALTKFRLSDHKLHIESGRHCNPPKPVEERLYKICNNQVVEDEIHFLLNCSHYCDLRSPLMQQAVTLSQNFPHLTPKEKFTFLMCTSHPALIQETALYIYKAMQARSLCLSPLID